MNKFFVIPATISKRQWFKPLCLSLFAAGWGCTAGAQKSPSVTKDKPVARIAGEAIYEEDLSASIRAQLRETRQHEYDLMVKAVQELARQKLLAAQAKRKGVTSEALLVEEVDKKIEDPTPAEMQAFYLAQRDHNLRSFDEIKDALAHDLRQAKIQAARDSFLSSLQKQTDLRILLQRPRVLIGYDLARLKGNPNASVKIVEFSDFDCPFCRQAESTVKELIERYKGRVSLAYRDFPLKERHPLAELAAEAARCAQEQGKFWEYHDLLLENQGDHLRDALLENARKAQLDEANFKSCLDSRKYKSQIEQDMQDAMHAGVSVTPSFFINGISLLGAQPASEFEKIIDEELRLTDRESTGESRRPSSE